MYEFFSNAILQQNMQWNADLLLQLPFYVDILFLHKINIIRKNNIRFEMSLASTTRNQSKIC